MEGYDDVLLQSPLVKARRGSKRRAVCVSPENTKKQPKKQKCKRMLSELSTSVGFVAK